eukprot:4764057-Ditylum_brightwellii.AAC.1
MPEELYNGVKQRIGDFLIEVMDGVSCGVRHVGCATTSEWICNNKHKSTFEAKRRRKKDRNKEMRSSKLAAYDLSLIHISEPTRP